MVIHVVVVRLLPRLDNARRSNWLCLILLLQLLVSPRCPVVHTRVVEEVAGLDPIRRHEIEFSHQWHLLESLRIGSGYSGCGS